MTVSYASVCNTVGAGVDAAGADAAGADAAGADVAEAAAGASARGACRHGLGSTAGSGFSRSSTLKRQ